MLVAHLSLLLVIFLFGAFSQAQARIRVTATEVVAERNPGLGGYGYSARFRVQVEGQEGKRENWVCGVEEVKERGKSWVGFHLVTCWEGNLQRGF